MGTIEYEPVPKYFTPMSLNEEGLSYPKGLYKEIQESSEPLVSVFHYIDDLGELSGDNFHLYTTLRTSFNERWAVCQAARIYLIGTKGAMIIPFSKIGCSSDNSLLLNDVYLDGKKNDLSAFTDIAVQVIDKAVIVSINGNKVYQARYSKSMGKLVGMRYKFLGLGEVQSFALKDKNGETIPLR